MAILRSMLAQRPTDLSRIDNIEDWLRNAWNGQPAASGIRVTEEQSLQVTAVYACVTLIADAIASLPLHVYRRTSGGKERATDHPLYRVLHDEPNDDMTSFQWREVSMVGDLLWGNAYSILDATDAGTAGALYPVTPSRVIPYRDPATWELLYDVVSGDGSPITVSQDQMLHVPALGFDGVIGRPPIGLMREAIGLAAVTEKHGASFFGRGARPGITLEHPKPLSPKAVRAIREMWNADHQGIENAHGVSVLGEGMKANSFMIPNEQAQFLETRNFQVAEIARAFRVPSWMIGDTSGGTAWPTAIENIGIILVVHTLRPWTVRWEQAMNSKLFSPAERAAGYYVEFDLNGLLRGDTLSRFQAHASALSSGWMNRNEVRQIENLNTVDGLDEFLTPSGGNAMKPVTGNPRGAAVAFAPLFQETWARVFRRERADRSPAEKKGQLEGWLEQHLAYAREQIGAVVEAYRAAGGECLSAAELVAVEHQTPSDLDPMTRAAAATERTLRGVR